VLVVDDLEPVFKLLGPKHWSNLPPDKNPDFRTQDLQNNAFKKHLNLRFLYISVFKKCTTPCHLKAVLGRCSKKNINRFETEKPQVFFLCRWELPLHGGNSYKSQRYAPIAQ